MNGPKLSKRIKEDDSRAGFFYRSGWLWISLVLVAVIFTGGAVRYIFSPAYFQAKLQEITAQQPGLHLEATSIQVHFTDGWRPAWGIHFTGLEGHWKRDCQESWRATADHAVATISLLSLLQGELKLDQVRLGTLALETVSGSCQQDQPTIGKSNSKENSPKMSANDRAVTEKSQIKTGEGNPVNSEPLPEAFPDFKVVLTQLQKHVRSWMKSPVREAVWSNAQWSASELKWSRYPDYHLSHVSWSGGSHSKLEGRLQKKEVPVPLHFQVELQGDIEKPVIKGELRLEEGHLQFEVQSVRQSDVAIEMALEHLPVSLIEAWGASLPEASPIKGFIRGPEFSWLHCQVQLESMAEETDIHWHFKACSLEGRLGKISVDELRGQGREFDPFTVAFENLRLEPLLDGGTSIRLSGLFNDLGEVQGQFRFINLQEWNFTGHWRKLQVRFSRDGRRISQTVNSAQIKVAREQDRISSLLSHIELEGGQAEGSLSLNFDPNFDEGLVQVALPKFVLHSDVQKRMMGGVFQDFGIVGQLRLAQSQIEHWQGVVKGAQYRSGDVEVDEVLVQASGQGTEWTAQTEAKSVRMGERILEWLKPISILSTLQAGTLLDTLRLELNWRDGRLHWTTEPVPLAKARVSTNGHWQPHKGLVATWKLDLPELKGMRWRMSGPWTQPQWSLHPDWIKELASLHRSRQPALDTSELETWLNDLRGSGEESLGQRLLDKARQWVPLLGGKATDGESAPPEPIAQ